jgi:hypothetical protein
MPTHYYKLNSSSCCIDAGIPYLAPSILVPAVDFEGDHRPDGSDYDIGADEFVHGINVFPCSWIAWIFLITFVLCNAVFLVRM